MRNSEIYGKVQYPDLIAMSTSAHLVQSTKVHQMIGAFTSIDICITVLGKGDRVEPTS